MDGSRAASPDVIARADASVAPAPLVPWRLAVAGAIVSGLLYFLAFAGFDQWYLTFVALAPLYVSLQGQPTKRATWLGFLSGLAMNLGGFYWLVEMLRTFSGFPTPLCLLFVVIICSYQAGRFALLGWLFGRASNRGWPTAPVFGAAFAASELVYPLLFPWYYAATVHTVPVLMQVADLGGPILVGLVLVAVNLAVAEPLRAYLVAARGRAAVERSDNGHEARGALPVDRRVVGVGVLALLGALVYGAARISAVKAKVAAAPAATVGYAQANMGLMEKRIDFNEGLRRHMALTQELRRDKGIDFVVWSESSVTRPVPEQIGAATDYYGRQFARALGVPAIFGAVLYRLDPDRDRWFNTAIATDVSGKVTGRYDKQFLLAFGEYLPFGDTFPILYKWSPHSGKFSAGTSLDPVVLDVKGEAHRVSVLICYEDILPGFTNRAVAHANPELLVNITNDAWFGDTTEPWEHLALAQFRAVEHRRYLVRSTNSGVSAIVDPTGVVTEHTQTFQREAQAGTIKWMTSSTVYEAIGDAPWYLATLGVVVASFVKRKPKKPAQA